MQRGVAVIPKTGQATHAKVNSEIFDFDLSWSEMRDIGGLDKNTRLFLPKIGGKPWCSDHPHYPFKD